MCVCFLLFCPEVLVLSFSQPPPPLSLCLRYVCVCIRMCMYYIDVYVCVRINRYKNMCVYILCVCDICKFICCRFCLFCVCVCVVCLSLFLLYIILSSVCVCLLLFICFLSAFVLLWVFCHIVQVKMSKSNGISTLFNVGTIENNSLGCCLTPCQINR